VVDCDTDLSDWWTQNSGTSWSVLLRTGTAQATLVSELLWRRPAQRTRVSEQFESVARRYGSNNMLDSSWKAVYSAWHRHLPPHAGNSWPEFRTIVTDRFLRFFSQNDTYASVDLQLACAGRSLVGRMERERLQEWATVAGPCMTVPCMGFGGPRGTRIAATNFARTLEFE